MKQYHCYCSQERFGAIMEAQSQGGSVAAALPQFRDDDHGIAATPVRGPDTGLGDAVDATQPQQRDTQAGGRTVRWMQLIAFPPLQTSSSMLSSAS